MKTETDPNTIAKAFPPGDFIREELEERGWSQAELAKRMGRPLQVINQIINGTKSVTAETAIDLEKALGVSARTWLNLEATYRLWMARRNREEGICPKPPSGVVGD